MPQKLKDKPQFCCWKYEERSGRKTKVPYNPVTGKKAKPNKRDTFKDFSSAVAAISDYDGSEQDKNLKREFAKAKNQSAILNWLIEGYQLLKKEGLILPDSVKTATEAYKRDSDKIALFFEDTLEESPNSEVRTSEVYGRYQRWCSANGCYSENARNFKQALTAIARVERKRLFVA